MSLLPNSDRAWQEFGKTEPYFAVCTQPQFKNENLTDVTRAEFFHSGEVHMDTLLRIVRQQLVPDFTPHTALDFGCGTGRLIIPLARQCRHVIGIDVSSAMLDEARTNCEIRGITNVTFYHALQEVEPPHACVDLVHTFIVLQHIPVKRGLTLFAELIDRIADNGVGMLHITYAYDAPRFRKLVNHLRCRVPLVHNLINVVRGRPWSRPLMQMNSYPLDQVLRLLYDRQCHNIVVRFTNHDGHHGVILLFQKRQREVL